MCRENEKITRTSRAGFSLIAVLVIAVIGMALLGVTFYIYESSVGQAANTIQRSLEYNALQDGLEKGKARLVSLCNTTARVPRWNTKLGYIAGTKITSPDQLILDTMTENVPIGGENGSIMVEIFDADYETGDVNSADVNPRASRMPPSVRVTADGASVYNEVIGSYLIRATLAVGGQTKRLETLVFQRNLATSITTGGGGGGGSSGGGNTNPGD